MLETDNTHSESYRGLDTQTSPTNLDPGVFTDIRCAAPERNAINRTYGKVLHTNLGEAVLAIAILENTKLVIQRTDEIHIIDL